MTRWPFIILAISQCFRTIADALQHTAEREITRSAYRGIQQ